MARVIGFQNPKICNCKKCGAIVEYQNIEIKVRYDSDYTGCSDTIRYIECPNCKNEISVSYT